MFGPVASPFYSVRFNSAEEIETKGIQPGDVVYCAPKVDEFTHYVFVEKLKQYCQNSTLLYHCMSDTSEQFSGQVSNCAVLSFCLSCLSVLC